MIRGRLIAAGRMAVDGELLVGCFVETTMEELRDNRPDIFEDVEIKKVENE
jgi:hypothetical protein